MAHNHRVYNVGDPGSFRIQRDNLRPFDAKTDVKNIPDYTQGYKSICFMPDVMSGTTETKNNRDRYMRLSRPISALPPFDNEIYVVTRRVNNKFVLNIPCNLDFGSKQKWHTTSIKTPAVCHRAPGLSAKIQKQVAALEDKIRVVQQQIAISEKAGQTQRVAEKCRQEQKLRLRLKEKSSGYAM